MILFVVRVVVTLLVGLAVAARTTDATTRDFILAGCPEHWPPRPDVPTLERPDARRGGHQGELLDERDTTNAPGGW